MYLLDTDVLSLFLRHPDSHPNLVSRVTAEAPGRIFISAISVEEELRGALSVIHRDRDTPRAPERYSFLIRVLHDLSGFNILPFDEGAQQVFNTLPASVRRAGSQDCRIAAIAITREMTVITRNRRHFSQVPGITTEDWAA